MASSEPAQPYVRVAKLSEYAEATRVLTRAFAKDPAMNWYGNVREMVDDIDNPGPTAKRTQALRRTLPSRSPGRPSGVRTASHARHSEFM